MCQENYEKKWKLLKQYLIKNIPRMYNETINEPNLPLVQWFNGRARGMDQVLMLMEEYDKESQ